MTEPPTLDAPRPPALRPASATTPSPPPARGRVRLRLLRATLMEYLEYDAAVARWLIAVGGGLAAAGLWAMRSYGRAFNLASRVHRTGGSRWVTAAVERTLAALTARERRGQATGLWDYFEEHTRDSIHVSNAATIVRRPESVFGYRALVLKSWSPGERGVLVVDYSYVFPLFAELFDVPAIAERYNLVLEPSWRGLCTADILCYTRYAAPVFVETIEPRDIGFIEGLHANFVTVPIAANWWVDHRLVTPKPAVAKEIDVALVAAWSEVKRHWRFFRVLSQLRRRGHRLTVALVGYRSDKTRKAIEQEARYLGVLDQIEIFENRPLEEVGELLARSRVHVLWSRKEGANRAIVEALFADVPIVVRRGLSYGFPYPYVNERTGCFADEDTLGDVLLDILARPEQFRPREWAMAHMSCQRATQILEGVIRERALAAGEPWTRGLAEKTVHLDSQRYWNVFDGETFADDYAFLVRCRRSTSPADRSAQ